jgi:hypothetical protein
MTSKNTEKEWMVEQTVTGCTWGPYAAEDKEEALEAFYLDAGYQSKEEADEVGTGSETLVCYEAE